MEKKSLKQSEGWAINLWHRYTTDLFFRTSTHIIAIQVALVSLVIVGLWSVMAVLERETSLILEGASVAVLSGQSPAMENLSANLEEVRKYRFLQVMAAISAVILAFGFITLYTALATTRLSLERKKRFIRNISHELRTPLSVVRTNTDVSLLDNELSLDQRKRLEGNIVELDRVTDIMNNILGLSNLMQDQHLRFEEIDLHVIAQRAIDSLSWHIDHKDVTITLANHTHHRVLGNASALEQAVFNLLKNAIAHLGEQGTVAIDISAAANGRYINLTVSDTGSGITSEDLFHVFEPFYRSSASRGLRNGQGLGLSIVNEIVQMHKGKIQIKSAPGRGTIATISIKRTVTADAINESLGTDDMEEISMDFSRRILH